MTGRKTFFGYLTVLVLVAIATVVVFSLPEKKPRQGLVLLDEKLSELTELVYSTTSKNVRVTPRQGGGFTINVRQVIKPPQPPQQVTAGKENSREVDGGSGAGQEAAQQSTKIQQATGGRQVDAVPVEKVKTYGYRASKEFVRELERLLPLTVERELGQVDDKHLTQFGLADSDRHLKLSFGNRGVEFVVGGQTYGGATIYLQRRSDGAVYLVSTALQRTLDIRPPRYLERRLVDVGRKDTDELVLADAGGSRQRRLVKVKSGRRDRWVPADDRQTSNNIYGTWAGQLFLLGAEAYLEKPPTPEPRQVARVRFFRAGKLLDELVLAEGSRQPGTRDEQAPPGKKIDKVYFARSSFTGQWVRLRPATARTLFDDVDTVFGK